MLPAHGDDEGNLVRHGVKPVQRKKKKCADCGRSFSLNERRYGETVDMNKIPACLQWMILQPRMWGDRRFCRNCWNKEVAVRVHGLDGEAEKDIYMVPRYRVRPGFLGRWGRGVIERSIICADGVYRHPQTGLEIIMMQSVKLPTCYGTHPDLYELNHIAEKGDLREGTGQFKGTYWCKKCWYQWRAEELWRWR